MKTETKVDIADYQDEEIWKDVSGYEGFYKVSSIGRVLSVGRWLKNPIHGKILHKPRIMSPATTKDKYTMVYLTIDGKTKGKTVHRLVAQAFIPNPKNKPCVNHKNGIKSDNKVENLEWVTSSENQTHALNTGLKVPTTGESHYKSIFTEAQVLEIRAMRGVSQKKIADMLGVHPSSISAIINRRNWKHI